MRDQSAIPADMLTGLVGQRVEVLPLATLSKQAPNVGKHGVIVSAWVSSVKFTVPIHEGEASQTNHKTVTMVQLRYEDGRFSHPLHLSRLQALPTPNPDEATRRQS